eukprot:GGOE01050237.1.p1 GENE.GGOE01050237.1~~GGOE01050237.1.p1  ORF type:complete len:1041 (-),score=297.07 GGOE01050237.1:140-3262(-)
MSLFEALLNGAVNEVAPGADHQLFAPYFACQYAGNPSHVHLLSLVERNVETQTTLDLLDVEEGEDWKEEKTEMEDSVSDTKLSLSYLHTELHHAIEHGLRHRDTTWYSPYDSPIFGSDVYLKWTMPALVALYHRRLRFSVCSVEDMLLGLLHTEASLQVVPHFIANVPALFHIAVRYLVSLASPPTRGLHPIVSAILCRLAGLGSIAATSIRDEVLAQRSGPNIALRLTLEVLLDPIDFLSSMLNHSGEFLFQFLKQEPATCSLLADQVASAMVETSSRAHRSQCLRLYCCLHLLGCLPLVQTAHSLVFTQSCFDLPTDRYVRLYICFCILTLADSEAATQERCCLALQSLARREWLQEPVLQVCTGYHTQQLGWVAEWVRGQLRVDLTVGPDKISRTAPLFTNAIVPIEALVRLLITVAPQEGICFPGGGISFVVVAVRLLLQRGLFQVHGVDASQWVYDVLERLHPHAGLPPAVVALLDALVENTIGPNAAFSMPVWSEYQVLRILNPAKVGDDVPSPPFHPDSGEAPDAFFLFEAEDDLSEAGALHASFDILKLDVAHLNRCIAVAYYVLLVQARRAPAPCAEAKGYGQRFVEALPLRFLLLQALADPDPMRYSAALPAFLRLVGSQFPHLLAAASLARCLEGLHAEVVAADPEEVHAVGDRHGPKALDGRLRDMAGRLDMEDVEEGSEAAEGALSLEVLQKAARAGLWTLLGQRDWWIEEVLPALLPFTPDDSRAMAHAFLRCWRRLADHIPEVVFPRTLLALLPTHLKADADAAETAALLVQVDPRVLHDVALAQLFLEVAQYCLEAAEYRTKTLPGPDPTQLQALVLTQRSMVLQFLLECCAANAENEEVVAAICQFLHQQFIDRPVVCRLLHFQTYPASLLPTLAQRVPSLHICLEFIPELLETPRLSRQVFAVQLAAQLLQSYPMPKAVQCATVALARVQQWCQSLSTPLTPVPVVATAGPPEEGLPDRVAHATAVAEALPSLLLAVRAYPPLASQLLDLLMGLKEWPLPDAVLHTVDEAFEGLLNAALQDE